MQVVQGGDGCGEVALRMVQLLYVSGNLFDLPGTSKKKEKKKKREISRKSVNDLIKIQTHYKIHKHLH